MINSKFSRVATLALPLALLALTARAEDTAKPMPAQEGMHAHGRHGEHFAEMDKDGDGRISKAEATASGSERAAKVFDRADADHDGYVTKDEARSGREQMKGQMRERMQQHFDAADSNHDGMISLGEAQAGMPRLAEHFAEIDTNKDGQLSKDELRQSMQKMRAGVGQRHRHDEMNAPAK